MGDISRRDAITMMAGAGFVLGLGDKALAQGERPQVPVARAFAGQHQPQPLRFDPSKLKGLSERLIRSHWENNY